MINFSGPSSQNIENVIDAFFKNPKKFSTYNVNREDTDKQTSNTTISNAKIAEDTRKYACFVLLKTITQNPPSEKNNVSKLFKSKYSPMMQQKLLNLLENNQYDEFVKQSGSFTKEINCELVNYELNGDICVNPLLFNNETFQNTARIYANISPENYAHFLAFMTEKSIDNNLNFKMKTRCNIGRGDSLVLYIKAEDLPKYAQYIAEYDETYKDKTKDFGSALSLSGKINDISWCGYGFEPQKAHRGDMKNENGTLYGTVEGVSTFNLFNDDAFNNYILPCVLMRLLTTEIKDKDYATFLKIKEDLKKMLPDCDPKFIDKLLDFASQTNKNFREISPNQKPKSKNILAWEKELGMPDMIREYDGTAKNLHLSLSEIVTEVKPFDSPMSNKAENKLTRKGLAKILLGCKSLTDACAKEFEENPELVTSMTSFYMKEVSKNVPFLSSDNYANNKLMQEAINEYKKNCEKNPDESGD